MKVTQNTKDMIADLIADAEPVVNEIHVNDIMTTLVESGFLDEEYGITDAEGNYDRALDELVQAYVGLEIRKQLNY